jgi:hypothetical protein
MSNNGFTQSIEATDEGASVSLLYQAGLGRAVDQSGFNTFVNYLGNGGTEFDVAKIITDSPEFALHTQGLDKAGIIDQMYMDVLGRHAEPDGLAYWLGMDLSHALLGISQSVEAGIKQHDGLSGLELAQLQGTVGDGPQADLSDYAAPPTVVTVEVPGPTPDPIIIHEPGPVVDAPDLTTTTHSPLDVQYLNASGNLFQGDGTTSGVGMTTVANPNDGLLFGVQVDPRQTDTSVGGTKGGYIPTSSSFDGVHQNVEFHLPSGTQSIDNGSFQNVLNRGAVNSNIVVGIDHDSSFDFTSYLAAGNKIEFKADIDNTAAVNLVTFHAVIDHANGDTLDFVNDAGVGFQDFNGNNHVASESFQQNFVATGGVAALTEGAQFDNYLTATDAHGVVTQELHWTMFLGQSGFSPADQLV